MSALIDAIKQSFADSRPCLTRFLSVSDYQLIFDVSTRTAQRLHAQDSKKLDGRITVKSFLVLWCFELDDLPVKYRH